MLKSFWFFLKSLVFFEGGSAAAPGVGAAAPGAGPAAPEAGPAAIAVAVNEELHYCWDAGECRLRYIWKGDFIDG